MSTERLPRRVQELIDLIGWSETLKLLNARGGTAVYFPKEPAKAHDLKNLVSPASLGVLCHALGGREAAIRLPKPDKMLLHLRNEAIIRQARAGASPSSLAISYGLTDRMIQKIVQASSMPVEEAQS